MSYELAQVEALDDDSDDFIPLDISALREAWEKRKAEDKESDADDELLPPLHRLRIAHDDVEVKAETPHKLTLSCQLDKSNPLQEARWVRSGEVDEWIEQNTSSSGEAGWRGKIQVVDPEPVRSLDLF